MTFVIEYAHPRLPYVRRYCPRLNRWDSVTTMPTQRSGFGACVIDGLLYVVGGMDAQSKLSSVDCYNPQTNTWSSLVEMSVMRSGLDIGVAPGVFL